MEQLRWLLLNYVVIFRKEFKEKKDSGEIAFVSCTNTKPVRRSPTLTAFVFLAKFAEFFNYKKFETRSP